jgi:hypothetical protein
MISETFTVVRRVEDFEVTGRGDSPTWLRAEWLPLTRLEGGADYPTRARLLYSATGIYVLIECADARLSCTLTKDFAHLFTEDVVEAFFWPDPAQPLYFEYELSPLNHELPLLIPNHHGRFVGWLPMLYDGGRRCRHATSVRGGARHPGAAVGGWTAEMFIPFALLPFSDHNPPAPGGRWRANLYRIDYDAAAASKWAWSVATGGNFHRYKNFGVIEFGP